MSIFGPCTYFCTIKYIVKPRKLYHGTKKTTRFFTMVQMRVYTVSDFFIYHGQIMTLQSCTLDYGPLWYTAKHCGMKIDGSLNT
jgi:hypothetical protein